MSKRIRHILLVPVEGDPHGLLRAGAPVAWECPHKNEWRKGWVIADAGWTRESKGRPVIGYSEAAFPHAVDTPHLRLAWEGEPVPEGCDRPLRLLADTFEDGNWGAQTFWSKCSLHKWLPHFARELGEKCEEHGLGRLVVVYCEEGEE
jgi:hypothetical protein